MKGNLVVAERFVKTLKSKIYKYMTSISKNVDINKLDDIVNKYNNTYRRTIKMKLIDVKPNIYINSSKEINDEDPKFKVGITTYKNIFANVYVPNWTEKVIKKLKTLCCGHTLLVILKVKRLLELFKKKNWKKQVKKSLELNK